MKKKKILLIVGVIAIVSAIAFGVKNSGKVQNKEKTTVETVAKKGEYKKVTSEEAKKMMETEKNYKIIDVRSLEEYNEGHIPNAILLPIENIVSGNLQELPDKNQLIMVYCRSGNRSRQAALKLIEQGYTNVVDFGGIKDWTGEIVK